MFWNKFVNKLSDKAFQSEEFQKSWKVHMEAFAPILEPAFAQDSGNRLNLIAALNIISRGDLKNGKKKLLAIKKACKTDADKAAWAYFMGLLYERSGDRQQMISHYSVCCSYNHRFYLPYLKLAKCAHEESVFEAAEENYRKGIGCLDDMPAGQQAQKDDVSAFTHANLGSCLIMMQRLDEAGQMLELARKIKPDSAGILASEAMLYAAKGQAEPARAALQQLKASIPQLHDATAAIVEKILAGEHSHFCIMPAREDLFEDFWKQFSENADSFKRLYEDDEDARVNAQIEKLLAPLFPFQETPVAFRLKMNPQGRMCLELMDGYSASLHAGCEKLLEACPEELMERWEFEIAH